MNKPIIAITGITGFIGSSIALELINNQYEVVALTRSPPIEMAAKEIRFFDLQVPVITNLLEGIDILIHCAFLDSSKNKQAFAINETGTKQLIENARLNGVKKVIFFSTIAANSKNNSEYANGKWRLEELFDPDKDAVLKPGLVVGNNGLYSRLIRNLLSNRVVPIVNGGRQPLQVISIADVVSAVLEIIKNNRAGVYILANHQRLTYREFFEIIARHYQLKVLYIRLSVGIVSFIIRIANALKIKLPIGNENIRSLESLVYTDPTESLLQLKLSPKSLEEILDDLPKSQK